MAEVWKFPNPWCCPEPRCTPLHQLHDADTPLDQPTPGQTWLCFGRMPEGIDFTYDGVEHPNDLRQCTYTPLKGVIAFQENIADWRAMGNAYARAIRAYDAALAGSTEGGR